MNNKMTRTLIYMAILILFSYPILANAQQCGGTWGEDPQGYGEGHKRGMGDKKGMPDFIAELNLTPEQQEQLKLQREENMKKRRELQETLKSKQMELRQEFEKSGSDEGKITSTAQEVKSLLSQLVDARINDIMGVKSILTPEQFEKFKGKLHSFNGRGKRKKGFRRGDSGQAQTDNF